MNEIQFMLIIIGGCTILATIAIICISLLEVITDRIKDLIWQYKHKHRFDKPPTAKCYCKDCKYLRRVDVYYNRCSRGHIETWNIADDYFCWQAEPLKSDPELVDKEK